MNYKIWAPRINLKITKSEVSSDLPWSGRACSAKQNPAKRDEEIRGPGESEANEARIFEFILGAPRNSWSKDEKNPNSESLF